MAAGSPRQPDPVPRDGAPRSAGELFDQPSERLQVARRLWATGARQDALALYAEAVRREPLNARTYVALARAQAEGYDFAAMEATHAQLVARGPNHPGVHHALGETFAGLKLPLRALECFARAAAAPGSGPPTWIELAALDERIHRLDEADELIARAVAAGFQWPGVDLVRSRVARRRGRAEEAESLLRGVVARAAADSTEACQAWAELALMADARDDYAGAAAAIARCKQGQRAREEPFLQLGCKVEQVMQRLQQETTPELLLRWRDDVAAEPPRPIALLTGFPRSGTTLLEQVLDAHPQAISAEERDFIGREVAHAAKIGAGAASLAHLLDRLTPGEIAALRRRYVTAMEYLLGEPIGQRLLIDKNPSYTPTIPLALRMWPELRLIVALRDPRDVVLSCYLRHLPLNVVSVHFLDVRRTAEKYARDLTAWLRYREKIPQSWQEVKYEETVADLPNQARRTLAGLGLPWDEAVLGYRERLGVERQVSSPTYEAVAQPIYRRALGRWRNYEELMAPALSILEPMVREFGYE